MPIAGRTAEDLNSRQKYFAEMIEIELASKALRNANLYYHPEMPTILTHIYFALTNGYKQEHIKPGNRTDAAKRAALTCATIAAVKPLRPHPDKNSLDEDAELYANSMLAMRCSCSIVRHQFHKRPFDDQRRIYRALLPFKLDCVENALSQIRAVGGIKDSEIKLELSPEDDSKLSLLVDDFVMYSHLTKPIQGER